MATNLIHDMDRCVAAVPYAAGVLSGQGMQVGAALFGIAQVNGAQNVPIAISLVGAWSITKQPAMSIAVGDRVFWDNTNRRITTTATSNLCVGVCINVAQGADATVDVMLGRSTPAGT